MTTRLILREQGGRLGVQLGHLHDDVAQDFGDAAFELPLQLKDLEELRFYLEEYLKVPVGEFLARGEKVHDECLTLWGEGLFAATFGTVPAWREAYGVARSKAVAGEPVEVLVRSADPRFLGLPWELLKDPGHPEPIALKVSSFIRTLPNTDAPRRFEISPEDPFRVLMVIARPEGEKDVGYQAVARPLFGLLAQVPGTVKIEVLRPPSFAMLQNRLEQAVRRGKPYHAVHFDGHGTFGVVDQGQSLEFSPGTFRSPAPQGYLCFEQETAAGTELVSAETFAAAVSRGRVPAIILNACRSGTVERGEASGPEASVATRLLLEGAAAVVAMSYNVYVRAAAAFMATFYEQLFQGRSIAEAMTGGRLALRHNNLRPSLKRELPLHDWIVPVHYGRAEIRLPAALASTEPDPEKAEDFFAQLLASAEDKRDTATGQAPASEDDGLAPEAGVFFGRDRQFYGLERAIRLQHASVIHGVGGTGKTELAKGFARWLKVSGGVDRDHFIFLHEFKPGVASFGLDGVLSAIGLRLMGANFALAAKTTKERARLVLEALSKYRMLLVWDNFESVASLPEPGQATPPLDEARKAELKDFVGRVRQTKSALLITSRSPEPWLDDEQPLDRKLHRLEVGGLDPEDAAAYADHLLAPYPRAQQRRRVDAFVRLVERLEGHPFSMRLILPRLQEVEASRLLAELKGETELPPGFGGGVGRTASLGASLEYSFRHLSAEDRVRLPVLALLEGVADADVLGCLASVEGTPPRFANADASAWKGVLDRCVALGLVSGLGAGMYRLHPALPAYLAALWRLAAGAAYDAEREAALRDLCAAYAAFGRYLQKQIGTGDAGSVFGMIAVQRRTLGTMLEAALERRLFNVARGIIRPLDDFWDAQGLGDEARSWTDRVRRATEAPNGEAPALDTAAGALWLFSTSSQANRALTAGRMDEAFAAYDATRRTLEGQGGDEAKPQLAVIYHQLGRVAQDRGDLEQAEAWYKRSLALEEERGNRPGLATSYHQLGIVAQHRGDLEQAEAWNKRSLALFEELGDRPGLARTYHQLGMVAQDRGDLEQAEAWCKRSLALKEKLGDRPGMARTYHQLGRVAQQRGDLEQAEAWYKRSLALFEELGDRPGLARTYHQLGRVAQQRGDLEQAEAWCKRSLALFEELGDRPNLAKSYHNLGMVAQDRGDLEQAEAWYKRSLAIKEELGDRPGLASSYHQLGRVAQDRGDLEQAEAWYKRSLAIKEELGDRPGLASSYHQLGRVAQDRGDLEQAEAWYKRSLAIEEELGNRPGLATSYHQLGIVAQDRGDLEQAEAWYKRSLAIKEERGDRPGLAKTYAQLGRLAGSQQQTEPAFDFAARACAQFDAFPNQHSSAPLDLARLAREHGMPALEASWHRVTGLPLPDAVRQGIQDLWGHLPD